MVRWLDEAEQKIWRRWLEVATVSLEVFDDRLTARHGLALTDYEILAMLSEAPDRKARMSDLAVRVMVSRSRLTYRIDRLVERGLVVREEATDDKRGLNARLTDEGMSLIESAAPGHVEDVREVIFDHIEADELAVIGRVLDKIHLRLPNTT